MNTVTGLPELPEGYFWRVSRIGYGSIFYSEWLDVAIMHRKKRKLLWDRIDIARVNGNAMYLQTRWKDFESKTLEDQRLIVKELALRVFEEFEKELDTLSRAAETASLLGDYPPKSLEGWPPAPKVDSEAFYHVGSK